MKTSLFRRVFRLLLLLYPADFRERFGSEMEQSFVGSLTQYYTKLGRRGLVYVWMRVLWDTIFHASAQRLRPLASRPSPFSGTYWESIFQDGRLAARRIRKTPGFTVVVVVTAAIGITVSTLVFTIINASVLRPPPHVANPDELVNIHREFVSHGPARDRISYTDFLEIRERTTTMVDVAAVIPNGEFIVRIGSDLEREVMGAEVSENYFQLLGRPLALGGGLLLDNVEAQIDNVVIGHGLWQRVYGGAGSVLGERMQIDGRAYTIVGVAPPSSSWGSEGGSIEAGVWIPIKRRRRKVGGGATLTVVGRRHEDLSMERVQAELDAIGPSLAALNPEDWEDESGQSARLVALTDLQSRIPAGARALPSLIMYFVFVGLIMVVTCSNVANLLLNRALGRRTEIALRLSLGSGRGRLVRQLLTESIFLFGLAGSLSLLLVHWLTQILSKGWSVLPASAIVDITIDPVVVMFTLAVTLASGLAFGLVPALQASRPDLMATLKGTGKVVRSRRFAPRNLFVLAQVAGSTVLVVISALMARDVQHADTLDIGFDAHNMGVLSLDLSLREYENEQGRQFLNALTERCEGIAGVEAVATAGWVPLSGNRWGWGGILPQGYEIGPDESPWANWNPVTPGYFDLMGIPLLRGRGFTDLDNADGPAVIVVNQAFAERFWPNQEPVGKSVVLEDSGPPAEVVGLVRNAKYSRADFTNQRTDPHFWLPRAQQPSSTVEFHFKTRGDPATAFGAVREQVRLLDNNLPILGLRRIETVTATALLEERVAATMFGGLGLVSLLLAILGIYGVMAYSILERTRELGIRLALGARPTRVVGMVVTESLALSAAGIVTGVVLAMLVARGIRTLLLGIGTLDPISFLGSVVLLGMAAMTASLIPAVRAARVDPVLSLKSE